MPGEEKPKVKVKVRRSKVPIWVRPDFVRYQYIITFWTDRMPPQTITMWEDEWSEEKERSLIQEYIRKWEAATTTTHEVPA